MAKEIELKYGCNPNQKPARIYVESGELPVTVLCGNPGYINFLDAFNAWQLVRELRAACELPAAASFKHVSPAGAALGLALNDTERRMFGVKESALSPLACAYARARGADRMSSFGDFIALSDVCDADTAGLIKREVSDGVIAPGYTDEALALLRQKRAGKYNVLQIDPAYEPAGPERRSVFGVVFEQRRNDFKIDESLLTNIVSKNKELPDEAKRDLIVGLITLKYTQSNSVCYVKNGQTVGVGAGQQSRIHCTRLAGNKADVFRLRAHEKVLSLPFRDEVKRPDRDNAIDLYVSDEQASLLADGAWQPLFTERPAPFTAEEKRAWLDAQSGVSLASDAFFPFGDNIERAVKSGVQYVVEAGGSVRDEAVIAAADKYGIALAFCGMRLFHH